MKEYKFEIDDPEFAEAKRSLNGMMQAVLGAILTGKTDAGTVNFKIEITSKVTDGGIEPETDYDCCASYKRREKINGNIHFGGMMWLDKNEDGEIVGMSDAPEQIAMEGV